MITIRSCLLAAWLLTSLLAAFPVAAETRVVEQRSADLHLSVLHVAENTALADIISGQARVGFTPLLTPGAWLQLQPDMTTWVRLRSELPARSEGEWVLRLERTPLQRVRLFSSEALDEPGEPIGFFIGDGAGAAAGAGMRIALPAGRAGPTEWYLEVQGDIAVGLLPQLLTRPAADEADASASRWLYWSLIGLVLVTLLASVRAFRQPRSGAGSVAIAAIALTLAILALSGIGYAWPVAAGFAKLGPMGLWTFLLLPCGPILLATASYSGMPYSLPRLVPYVRRTAFAMPAVAALLLLFRSDLNTGVQWLVWLTWAAMGPACIAVLLMDSRTYRWVPIVTWLLVMVALWLRASVEMQMLGATSLTLLGPLPPLVLLMASMLALPWLRSIASTRQVQKRAEVKAPSSAEPIALALNQYTNRLHPDLSSASGGEVEGTAFHSLLSGLRPVMPQTSSAMVVMNYHGVDFFQAKPADAEARYRTLLEQRSSLLRGLSRARGAQQLTLDFDGPEGPLQPVQVAIIPLPIESPGWGVLLVERQLGRHYSEEELELCSQFAARATTSRDQGATRVRIGAEAELDQETRVLRAEQIRLHLEKRMQKALLGTTPVTVMKVDIDGLEEWLLRDPVEAGAALRLITETVRDELEFGESMGRLGPLSFLMLLHGRNASVCRPVADRIMIAVGKLGLPMEIQLCIGISELRHGDSTPDALIERAGHAVNSARRAGSPCTA